MSDHRVETFELQELRPHPNADTLSIATVNGTDFSYVCKTAEWKDHVGKLVCYVMPDSIVPLDRPEFSFLGTRPKDARIRAKRLRGVVSYGLLVKAPEGLKAGDDAAAALGVTHYEPDEGHGKGWGSALGGIFMGGEVAETPICTFGDWPKYDLENYLKYGRKVLTEGEMVYLSEKCHGSNSRYIYAATKSDSAPKMHVGSRTRWTKEVPTKPEITLEQLKEKMPEDKALQAWEKIQNWKPKKNAWWQALEETPTLRAYCEAHPNYCVFGEIYGSLQAFSYGCKAGEVRFAAFDILKSDGKFMGAEEFLETCQKNEIPTVPSLGIVPYNHEEILKLCEGPSLFPNATNIREGLVLRSKDERWSEHCGRVALKCINPAYLEKN